MNAPFRFPVSPSLQKSQPLLLLREGVYAPCRQGSVCGGPSLFTAFGIEHPFQLRAGFDALSQMMLRINAAAFNAAVQETIRSRQGQMTPLEYFVNDFFPERERWLLGQQPFENAAEVDIAPCSINRFTRIANLLDEMPCPRFPVPSLWLFGRALLLKRAADDSAAELTGFHVVTDEGRLTLSGQYVLVRSVAADWEMRLRTYVEHTTLQVLALEESTPTEELQAAQSELRESGYVVRGNYVFIDRDTPLLGHWLDEHANRSLRRQCNRDICVAAQLTLPPTRPDRLYVLELRSGRWGECSLKKGHCKAKIHPWVDLDTPGLSLAEHLFQAATHHQLAKSFHEHD